MSGIPRDYPGAGAPENDPTVVNTEDVVQLYRAAAAENGRMRGQIREAIAILESGTEYERRHVVSILENGLGDR